MNIAKHSPGYIDKRGYRILSKTVNGRRRAIREHRLVMEIHLGRELLPTELVHHINGVKDDNRIENLQLSAWDEHTVAHHTGSKRADTTKRTMEVFANYRENEKHLRAINAELLAVLKQIVLHSGTGYVYAPDIEQAKQLIEKVEQ